MPTADIWQKNSLKYTGQPKVTLLESSYCKHFPSRIPLSTWFWSISTPEKLLSFKIWLSRSNFTFYERADWWKKNHGVYDASYNGVISDRATPATQNGHDKSIRHRFQAIQQVQAFFLLKYLRSIFGYALPMFKIGLLFIWWKTAWSKEYILSLVDMVIKGAGYWSSATGHFHGKCRAR